MIWLLLVAVLLAWVALGPWVVVAVVVLLCLPRMRWWLRDRTHFSWRTTAVGGVVAAVLAGLVVLIPDGWLPIPQSPGLLVTPGYLGRPATSSPVVAQAVPQHPFMARNGANSMHNDAWATDAYDWSGPVGEQPEVDTAWYGIKECATLAFDEEERLIGLCGDITGPSLHVIDPESMRPIESMDLPDRKKSEKKPWEDLCGGAYFYLDNQQRAVLATTDRQILAVSTSDAQGKPALTTDATWDLRKKVPEDDCLIALMPDWKGRIWFETQKGVVGNVAPHSGEVKTLDLQEQIANSFAVDETGGVYVVTVEALYRLEAGAGNVPRVAWRETYDRGSRQKPGLLSQGSGTTPTIIDNGIIAITDNAEPRTNVVFIDRTNGKTVCKQPVFEADKSGTENSLVSVGVGVIAENNVGYGSPTKTLFGMASEPGIARVDLLNGKCNLAWTNNTIAPSSVPKVSWKNGLLYVYAKRPTWWGVSAWYFTAIDAHTGRTEWAVRTGTGILMNNHYAAVTLAPDGSAWIATLAGMVRIRDRERD